ncbi:ATP-binding protein [Flavobacterium sp.]|uniref:sensor histidine kinase n=1 Tax=Flavobacterium sp. TaxID=239 RepID=UPI00375086F8
MITPEKYKEEDERIKLLESYSILDTLPEIDYDNLTTIAAEICGTPISLISFVDKERQWFKSHYGLDVSETPRDYSFCAYAINDPDNVFIIGDSRTDIRFHDNPIVSGDPNVIFYAGVPLKNENGLPIGTLCVIDHKPKTLTQNQIRSLKALSDQTMKLLDLRLKSMELKKAMIKLEKKNQELERFANIAAHDLKSPLANVSGLADFFIQNYGSIINDEGHEIIHLIKSSSNKLREMIDGLLEYSKTDKILNENKTEVNLQVLKNDISNLFVFKDNCSITFKSNIYSVKTNKTAIEQILINLVANAIKYNDKEIAAIEIEVVEEEFVYKFSVNDNGSGILKEDLERIFQIFEVLSTQDRFGQKGNGIGLATVKKIVEDLGGTIYVESEIGKGSKFIFTIGKL